MKKLLTLFLITALTLSCLAGCGSNEPAESTETSVETETQQTEETSTETEVVESETEEVESEEATEETSEEVAEPEIATTTMQSEDGSVKIEITYNAAVYDYEEYDSSYVGGFGVKENVDLSPEKYGEHFPGGCQFEFRANSSAQAEYDIKLEACNSGDVPLSEMEQFTIGDKAAYVFSDNYYKDDWKTITPCVVIEIDNNVLIFFFNTIEGGTHEDCLGWVDDFFVDAKVIE